jgi:hypothetical protein
MDIWRLTGVRGNTDQGTCPMCDKEEGWGHILTHEETRHLRKVVTRQNFHKY